MKTSFPECKVNDCTHETYTPAQLDTLKLCKETTRMLQAEQLSTLAAKQECLLHVIFVHQSHVSTIP